MNTIKIRTAQYYNGEWHVDCLRQDATGRCERITQHFLGVQGGAHGIPDALIAIDGALHIRAAYITARDTAKGWGILDGPIADVKQISYAV